MNITSSATQMPDAFFARFSRRIASLKQGHKPGTKTRVRRNHVCRKILGYAPGTRSRDVAADVVRERTLRALGMDPNDPVAQQHYEIVRKRMMRRQIDPFI